MGEWRCGHECGIEDPEGNGRGIKSRRGHGVVKGQRLGNGLAHGEVLKSHTLWSCNGSFGRSSKKWGTLSGAVD